MSKKEGSGKKIWLLPRLAVTGIGKNASTYLPYIGVCIFAVFTYFVFDLILHNDVMHTVPRAAYAAAFLQIGFILLNLIMIPFLYYTNSFLIKRRKRELGLYSILGMEKKHIGVLMLFETAVLYVIVSVGAILLGIIFSRLMFLLLLNLAGVSVKATFSVSPEPVMDTLLFFGAISVMNLVSDLWQVGKVSPTELLSESKKGEKQVRAVWLWSILGVLTLGYGYKIALETQVNGALFVDFFAAVFLVVAGTYFLFTSGSVFALKRLKGWKRFYYKPQNFITVSGMLYRMKKNAASLVNICIFGTMVIITMVCTVSLYLGIPGITEFNYPHLAEVNFSEKAVTEREEWKARISALADENGVEITDFQDYAYVDVRVGERGGRFEMWGEGFSFDEGYRMNLLTLEEWNQLEGTEKTLAEDEVLIYSNGPDFGYQEAVFPGRTMQVKEELLKSSIVPKSRDNYFGGEYYMVVRDEETLWELAKQLGADSSVGATWRMEFDLTGQREKKEAFARDLSALCAPVEGFLSCDYFQEDIDNQEAMYGGLLFIGIFFGAIFMLCLLIIMYYKQITEGFEDQRSFDIMQKVGMSDLEVKKTIRKQIMLVFFLPLLGAVLHTCAGMNLVIKLMGAIGMFMPGLIILCAVGVCVVFAALYCICYYQTAKSYYRIVRKMHD